MQSQEKQAIGEMIKEEGKERSSWECLNVSPTPKPEPCVWGTAFPCKCKALPANCCPCHAGLLWGHS